MRVVMETGLPAGLAAALGETPRRVLRFSEAERRALRRAAEIADQARALWRESVDYDVDGEDMDTELAMIGIAVGETIDGIEIG